MNAEKRQKCVCHDCGKDNCVYVNRSLEYKCPFLDAVMYGWKFGFSDAIDNACDFLKKRMWEMNSPADDTSYVVDGVSSSISEFIKNFIDYMEGQ